MFLIIEVPPNLETILRAYKRDNEDLEETAQRILSEYIPTLTSTEHEEFMDEYKRSFSELKKTLTEQNTANSVAMLKLIEDRLKNNGFIKPGEFGFYFNED